jgi:NnrS protein/uncharacterized protein DUF1858
MPRNAWPDERVLIPDLLRDAPQVRPVLDRYGLRGCGGPLGPRETLAFFAQAHDVALDLLLREIRASLEQTDPRATPAKIEIRPGDAIYRPFFKAGIAVVLTLGAAWGAYLLVRIGWTNSFRSIDIHEVNAHGHAQIFGWVGLFVMGFAYQAFPRFKHGSLSHPGLALTTLWLMLGGIVTRSICEPLTGAFSWLEVPAVIASGIEVVAIGLFIWILLQTWKHCAKPLVFYDYYILCALFWFIVQAIYETLYLACLFDAGDRTEVVKLVASWQGPLREIQIHGFALLMILGVSQRVFHNFYGLPEPNRSLSRCALWALNLAVVGEVVGLVLMRQIGHAWSALWYGSVLLLAGTVFVLVRSWRIFSLPEESDRSLKFLRAAYVWLFISLGMLVVLPAHQFGLLPWLNPESQAVQTGFSHAYYGAIRHAITVGFISLMIVGVAAKVVPTLNGVDIRSLARLWLPFLLINLGCALRVSSQVLTDISETAFPVAGISGVLEVLGLTIWGIHLWLILAGRARLRTLRETSPPVLPGMPFRPEHRVGDILERYPELLETFLALGFKALANPWLRKTLARRVTVASACRFIGTNADEVLRALNDARPSREGERISLPMLSPN